MTMPQDISGLIGAELPVAGFRCPGMNWRGAVAAATHRPPRGAAQ